MADDDFGQLSALPQLKFWPSAEESMVGEQLKMLSYADFALAVGLCSADPTGDEATDTTG